MQREAPDAADLAHCQDVLRAGSKTFAAAARLLPTRVREPATVLYAFCRVADDAVDDAPGATVATVQALGARLDRAYAGRPDDAPIDRALAAVVRAHRVPRALLDALLEGLAWDAAGRRYETLDELYAYAARVAGTVGAMMTVLMGARTPELLARACDLGVAMQLTNIARDVGEDASRGRLYLPAAWMRDAGIAPDAWLAKPQASAALASVVARLLASADVLYRRADDGIAALPRDCRAAIFAARLVYSEIGAFVARAGHDSVGRRARVPSLRKAWLVLRALARAWFPRASPAHARAPDPPLESVRFLLRACSETP